MTSLFPSCPLPCSIHLFPHQTRPFPCPVASSPYPRMTSLFANNPKAGIVGSKTDPCYRSLVALLLDASEVGVKVVKVEQTSDRLKTIDN
ncbi:hypothetical protein XELAEV_18024124mg [Xenopus laevis]|uniref:Uncharacterized protein n=1 Tax=Xenopus laevis TaxID=8355 RepID=A0A974HPU6_XENLA|nr:hypothetical protein XELAEV_18024124mg [Xenopus laevis]